VSYRSNMKVYGAGSQATIIADISTWMQAMGWTLEDTISATSMVFSSLGEDGARPKGWLHLYISGNNMVMLAYTFWNTATHTGYGSSYTSYNTIALNAAGTVYFAGNKNLVGLKHSAVTQPVMWGHWPTISVDKPRAVLANAESAGSNVVVELDNTDRFYVNDYYVIADFSTGCRERVQVNAVNAGVSITITTLANNYSAGSIIGYLPTSFGVGSSSGRSNWFLCVHPGCSGTAAAASAGVIRNLQMALAAPDYWCNLYNLPPIFMYGYDASLASSALFACDENFMTAPDTTVDNLYGVMDDANQYISGKASAGGATYLDVAGTPFTEDALIGKILVLTGGTGAGQTRYITDNTASRIVVGQAWAVNPNATTTFYICDRVYRNVGQFFNNNYQCMLERIGEP